MPSSRRNLLAASGAGGPGPEVGELFSSDPYSGNSTLNTITNGVDIDGEGGLVWLKRRSGTISHQLMDTTRDPDAFMGSDVTDGSVIDASHNFLFLSTGFSLDTNFLAYNATGSTYSAWMHRKADSFFDVQQVVKAASTTKTVDLSSLGTVGMVAVKRIDAAGSWFVFHKDLTSGKLLILNTDAAEATDGSITVSGTTLSLIDGVIADGTYVVYAWAHNRAAFGESGTDTIAYFGVYTGNGSTTGPSITAPGWKPQYVEIKAVTATGNWTVFDTARGIPAGNDPYLEPNTTAAEVTTLDALDLTANGFNIATDNALVNTNSIIYMYMAIREE